MFNNQIIAGSSGQGGFEIEQSLKFNDDESQYLSWTPASAGNRKTWTWSGWVKLAQGDSTSQSTIFGVGGSATGDLLQVLGGGNGQFRFFQNGASTSYLIWNGKLRDVSAWYHIVLAVDTTQATSSDRVKLYLNGEQLTSFSTETYPSQNYDGGINNSVEHGIGRDPSNQYRYFDGYMSDIYFIDGTALDPTSFGETVDGYWKPKEATGLTYGTNGFHLNFKDDIVSEGFNAVTYTGNGSSQSISGLGFSPDFVWCKRRDAAANHVIYDSVRGTGAELSSSLTAAESTGVPGVTAFDADGFTLGNNGNINDLNETYVGWCWDAGTGSAASNTDGSITSTVKANTSYGFSVTSYTGNGTAGATIGHGLSSAPEMIIAKVRNAARDWPVYHSALGGTKFLALDLTMAASTSNVIWYDTNPTSSVFTVGSDPWINNSSDNYIAYCFHSVSGYSSFGSFSGSGAAGNAVTCGFRPAFVMIKRTDSVNSWVIIDATRDTVDIRDSILWADLSDAEASGGATTSLDFTDTGFEFNGGGGSINASGGTYIYMAFADTREYAFWKDVSGNGNNWTPNNLDYRDSLPDTPTNNFATLNPLNKWSGTTLSEGNTKVVHGSSANGWVATGTTMGLPNSGKWYAETRVGTISGSDYVAIGIVEGNPSFVAQSGDSARFAWGRLYFGHNGIVGPSNTTVQSTSVAPTYTTGDIISIAWDGDNGDVWWAKNGVWTNSGNPATGTNPAYTGLSGDFQISLEGYTTSQAVFNAGQDSTFAGAEPMGSYTDGNGIGNFQYAPPSGYLALCTSNLPTPTIVDGSQHFNTVLYTGNDTNPHAITGVGFQPDFVWLKSRQFTTVGHSLQDILRPIGGNNSYPRLVSNSTAAESANSGLLSFDSDGFTLNTDAFTNSSTTGGSMVAWNWKAGGTAVSNTSGSITSQVSANTDMGFSVVSYTGTGSAATVGHGLSAAPQMIVVKSRNIATNWNVFHTDIGNTKSAMLNLTDTPYTNSAYWNNTSPTSSVFSIGSGAGGDINSSGNTYIAYCFANSDIIKVGSYTGNGSNDGPFIFLGFRPALFLTKRTDTTSDWQLLDTARDPYNAADAYLKPNTSGAEATGGVHDFVSNGFKIRNSGASQNASGGTYIYLAIAETPFKYAPAR